MLESVIEEKEPEKPVDRTKTCPFLLRVFCSNNRHHLLSEYTRGNVPSNELQIYTWKDATLKELTKLIQEVNPETRRRGTFFDFAVVYPDPRMPVFRMKDIGTTCSGQKGPMIMLPWDHLGSKSGITWILLSRSPPTPSTRGSGVVVEWEPLTVAGG